MKRASCTGAAGSWSQHRGSCVLFGPGPRSHASVGLRPSLKASAWRGRRLRTAQKGTKRHAQHEAARAQEPGRFYRIGVLETSPVPPSKAALGPHELHSARQHKKIGLTVRRVILNDFFRRNREPLIFYPSIPSIFWIPFVSALYLKFRLYGVGYPTTEKRFFVSVWMLGVIRTFETLKPMLVRSVRPIAARKKFG
jgi:hypothetical protein